MAPSLCRREITKRRNGTNQPPYTRAEENWGKFKADVDYVVPLGKLHKSFISKSVQCDVKSVHLGHNDSSYEKRDEQNVSEAYNCQSV